MISNKKAMDLLKSAGTKKFNPGPAPPVKKNEALEYQRYIARIRRRTDGGMK